MAQMSSKGVETIYLSLEVYTCDLLIQRGRLLLNERFGETNFDAKLWRRDILAGLISICFDYEYSFDIFPLYNVTHLGHPNIGFTEIQTPDNIIIPPDTLLKMGDELYKSYQC
ncbi:hypothetical protein EIN_398330 [Entamoeba invadens IP1]|uniref:Uncharacterized protein n=1 Tax=Entamoeba invadens IP1 TaxID=370355 RepID=A0A0A1UA23_ENTIV|nr:hypothetical protein EIN_398330 [Entamoeba invadens IP1]ELP91903.1 hypothetical protein EIN_398330 [Entamoeba invadens IP1]|eukprot:XP_004258674.1 hypothetical protein EIN_398330 [Entamoeba invadens IP1]